MTDARPATGAPGFYVFRRIGDDRWQLVGEAARRPGLTADTKEARPPGATP